ncbi:MAG TPA: PAS domain S-box protein [Bacteroidota bacterium]|nr:PAS domain S-box protein [Bacteroidota bacterium]
MLKRPIRTIRVFFKSLGVVEQAQVVASTAVVVAMVAMIMMHIAVGEKIRKLDFISILTVGIIGYVGIFFMLKYGRILEEQRKQLAELNTIAEALNSSVELNTVLLSALIKVMELMNAEFGWIYLEENGVLTLRHHYGTSVPLFPLNLTIADERLRWIRVPGVFRTEDRMIVEATTPEFSRGDVRMIASIPLQRPQGFAGVLIIGSSEVRKFEQKKIALIQAFANQIGAALNNASLFEQVRESEQLYQDLYEHSPDMYHTVTREGIVLSCNLTECKLLGYPKEEIVGKPLLNLYPPDQHQHVLDNLKRIFEEGEELRGVEEQMLKSDHALLDVSVNTSLIRSPDGTPRAVRVVLRDITEKKKMEEKILQAQKIDSIGNLAGGIAHDFNNILTAILGSASIMRRRIKDDQRWMKYVDLIESTSRRGAAVTRQLLTFARKNSPRVDKVDVNVVIEQTIRLFEVTAPKSIHIKCEYAGVPLMVEADESQLQQALLNLCLNARDAMPNGGVLVIRCNGVEIGSEEAKEATENVAGPFVKIMVADSGVGIPPQVLSRIYEPFFTTKEQGKGTGLGLSVVYGVIRGHNGYINVKSELNSGTEFTMYLPRIFTEEEAVASHTDTEKIVGGTERILLIDDEVSVGEIGIDILRDLGYRTDGAQNGREGLEKLNNPGDRPYDLVILDMNMPRLGGRETFDQIKEAFPQMKVMVCSGYSSSMLDDAGRFVQKIDGFIQKPYELADLAQKIRGVLDAQNSVRRTRAELGIQKAS